jgi:hypothetical protein
VGFSDNRDPIIAQIALPFQQQADIVAFLSNALTDPRVRDETFPFDRPVLVTDRAADMPASVGGGVAGTGGVIPAMIAEQPPMVGNVDFRLGVDGVPPGAAARLGVSVNPPVSGVIVPDRLLDAVTANGTGTATVLWPLHAWSVAAGQTVYVQWFVADANAPGGESVSGAASLTFFCGLYGCPTVCLADYNHDEGVDGDDVIAFFADWDAGEAGADVNQDGGVDGDDVIEFFAHWDAGC